MPTGTHYGAITARVTLQTQRLHQPVPMLPGPRTAVMLSPPLSPRLSGQGERQLLYGQQRRDVGLEPLPAQDDGLDPADRVAGTGRRRLLPQLLAADLVGQLDRRTELEREDVAVEPGQIQQGPVQRVPLEP